MPASYSISPDFAQQALARQRAYEVAEEAKREHVGKHAYWREVVKNDVLGAFDPGCLISAPAPVMRRGEIVEQTANAVIVRQSVILDRHCRISDDGALIAIEHGRWTLEP